MSDSPGWGRSGDSYLRLPDSPLLPGEQTVVVEVDGVVLSFDFVL